MADANQDCSHKGTCSLFPLLQLRSSLKYWMDSYCNAEFGRCARYQSMKEGSPPPPTMLPNGKTVGAIER